MSESVIKTLQKVVNQHLKTIGSLKEKIHDQELIIKGMSEPYESRYLELQPKLMLVQERVIKFFKTRKGVWIKKDDVERLILNRYPNVYSSGTVPRACRKLTQDGLLIVRYENNTPYYALNLKYGE